MGFQSRKLFFCRSKVQNIKMPPSSLFAAEVFMVTRYIVKGERTAKEKNCFCPGPMKTSNTDIFTCQYLAWSMPTLCFYRESVIARAFE